MEQIQLLIYTEKTEKKKINKWHIRGDEEEAVRVSAQQQKKKMKNRRFVVKKIEKFKNSLLAAHTAEINYIKKRENCKKKYNLKYLICSPHSGWVDGWHCTVC